MPLRHRSIEQNLAALRAFGYGGTRWRRPPNRTSSHHGMGYVKEVRPDGELLLNLELPYRLCAKATTIPANSALGIVQVCQPWLWPGPSFAWSRFRSEVPRRALAIAVRAPQLMGLAMIRFRTANRPACACSPAVPRTGRAAFFPNDSAAAFSVPSVERKP